MATRKKAVDAPVEDTTDRSAAMRKAYQQAEARLKETHAEEWNALLTEEYASAGLEVRRRLTDEERAARAAAKVEAKRQKLIAALNALDGGVDEPLPFEDEPFEVAVAS